MKINVNNIIVSIEKNQDREIEKEIVKRGIGLKVPFENTWTCYNGRDKSCGRCITCSNRIKSFIMNGLPDSLPYEIDIPWEKLIEKVRKK